MTALLSLRGVTKRFGGLVAVNRMDFDVTEHQVLGLIGPNGSGKSTTLNLISGAFPVTSGAISLRGQPITHLAAQDIARRGVARTFQLVRLLPSMTVLQNVKAGAVFGHRRHWGHEADAVAEAMLEKVGLAGRGHMMVGQLTYIDTKRVELARVLAGEPGVVLLDEWLAGLNPTELEEGIRLIRGLRDEGRTVILVEHVMDAIRSLCDRCVVMAAGTKIAEGTPAEVLSDAAVIRAYLGDDDDA
ncbi:MULTISPECIES: ABC transporter ATP-binding protein [Neorhizobium]|jgi:branched-chain amino acid transport system ATP-binding protein|uniref:ABC transporter ATP-binding protein n=1 Tax=Neorhizobium TaxID=1525371 RepID=UPI000621E0B3|nr:MULTISPECIES: ABC transporter ATP-binding protein [Neorhizobium]CDZ27838.1 HAAT family [Neorhizobium galegae bv. officinalis]CDZ60474.1 HAAT family [Neorhizobium galegae bv. orientalis]KAA9382976.1 ABC transporter ATP-binding protein [Neorhizobium galegae]KAB1111197.1 ABC transporter ATP-binding protein [Neorhizobium galegae]KAB1121797.1 ABC transporter ATP-binding protein [Neorhizobium galegae]